ncbi:MAG: leucine-rich repeat protein [Oscillospiraceae bacterium]|nr:leucine-rich repeat protein [Oscillospiraceae bacterium]
MKQITKYMLPFVAVASLSGTTGILLGSPLTTISTDTDGDYTYTVCSDGKSIELTKYTGSECELTIPAELDGKPVTSVGAYAFAENTVLTSVTIPDSVKSIGNSAFTKCTRLTWITIPEGVTTIGQSAFASTNLSYVKLPESIISIEPSAFVWCSELSALIIPNPECAVFDSAETINNGFWNDEGVAEYYYNGTIYGAENSIAQAYAEKYGYTFKFLEDAPALNQVKPNGDYQYEINADGKTVTILKPNSLESAIEIPSDIGGKPVTCIGDGAFEGLTNLQSVVLPDSVMSLGSFAFGNCTNLTSITLPDGLNEIGSHAFFNCGSLTEVALPDSVEKIGDWAFANCTALTFASIPKKVTNIKEFTYSGCDQLAAVTIPENVKKICYSAFSNCKSLASVTIQNPDCLIDDHKDTFNIVHNPIDVTIYGYKGSTAQSYAEKYSYQFKLICTLGDLDSNGTVNAKDANEVLIVAAEIGTRKYIGLTEVQQKAADVNLDGSINAKDAAWILRYAAAVGTGPVSGTLEEYMNNG